MTDSLDRERLQEMIQRAAAGDDVAWREIVEMYSPRVFGLIRAQCGSADLAEEITQSTFCTIVTKISGYTETGKFEPWLFRIAMNRLRDEMRRRKRQARPAAEETLIGLSAPSIGTEPARTDASELTALRNALSQLSEADQKIIQLRHFGGLTFKQIADFLDQPLGTVLARQHRALKKLQSILTDREPEE